MGVGVCLLGVKGVGMGVGKPKHLRVCSFHGHSGAGTKRVHDPDQDTEACPPMHLRP